MMKLLAIHSTDIIYASFAENKSTNPEANATSQYEIDVVGVINQVENSRNDLITSLKQHSSSS